MASRGSSRREFLRQSGPALGGSLFLLKYPAILAAASSAAAAQANNAPWVNLDDVEAETLGAVVDQIFPPDEQPGAQAIGAVYFIDAALSGFMASALPLVQAGCKELDQASMSQHDRYFRQITFDQQTAILGEMEDSPFFGLVHFQTLCGVFASPKYGGNKDHIGWTLLGFKSQHAWQPPFGHYDAEHRKESDHG